jgi:hypothetical protein
LSRDVFKQLRQFTIEDMLKASRTLHFVFLIQLFLLLTIKVSEGVSSSHPLTTPTKSASPSTKNSTTHSNGAEHKNNAQKGKVEGTGTHDTKSQNHTKHGENEKVWTEGLKNGWVVSSALQYVPFSELNPIVVFLSLQVMLI